MLIYHGQMLACRLVTGDGPVVKVSEIDPFSEFKY